MVRPASLAHGAERCTGRGVLSSALIQCVACNVEPDCSMPDSAAPSPSRGREPGPLRDGYTDIPAGRIAAIATTLEMQEPPPVPTLPDAPHPELRHVERPALGWYRDLFRRIGEPWLWQSRLRLSDEALARILCDPAVEVWAASADGEDVGLVELDFREVGSCELAFFGLTIPWTGRRAGRCLMRHATERAWARPIRRFWVHTCTLDHPGALGFYIRSGFRPIKRQVEMSPDPRLDGTLSPDAAPSVPIIR
jgi:GNAT superfamily N-acetyltransferase